MNQSHETTAERIRDILDYDSASGRFTWVRPSGRRAKAGSAAGANHGLGYLTIGIDGRRYFAHRLAWLYVHGVWPRHEIDHINGVRDDNRISNLREATKLQNMQNCHFPTDAKPKSGFRGVYWYGRSNCWVARIGYFGKEKFLGYFANPEDGHKKYLEAKLAATTF